MSSQTNNDGGTAVPVIEKTQSAFENKTEEELERRHFYRIVNTYKAYRLFSLRHLKEITEHYNSLSDHHKSLIPSYVKHIESVKTCIDSNQQIFSLILKRVDHMFEQLNGFDVKKIRRLEYPRTQDMDKVRTILRQLMRDWSSEGELERQESYGPVISSIKRYLPQPVDPTGNQLQILVPGAGLGRLMFDIASVGYGCHGNEWSLIMLFASNFVLNNCREINTYTIYPWVHSWTNNLSYDHQIRPVLFPDVNPSTMESNPSFSMTAGDFLQVHVTPNLWDAVATVYFIDTANNIIQYIENIWKILKPGGYWFNNGPLLYHYSDIQGECSIDLSYEEIRHVIQCTGFTFLEEQTNVPSTYTQNKNSMLRYTYDCVFFVARKPPQENSQKQS